MTMEELWKRREELKREAALARLNAYSNSPETVERRLAARPNYFIRMMAIDPRTNKPRTEAKYRRVVQEYNRRVKAGMFDSPSHTERSNPPHEIAMESADITTR